MFGQRAERVVLRPQLLGLGQELLVRLLGPPVADPAGLVVLAALIVEAVPHLVADDRADAAVVHRRIRGRIEERRLQDRGGEGDLVHRRAVLGVHGLRVHPPLGAIDRPAEARDAPSPVELAAAADVLEERRLVHREGGVVAPFRRVADAGLERGQLLLRFGARLVVHPGERLQALAHGGPQVGDERIHRRLVPGREVPGDVELAQALADQAVEQRDAALPAFALHLDAAEDLAVEGEAGVVERLREVIAGIVGEMEGQVLLPGRHRLGVEERRAALDRGHFAHDDARDGAQAARLERRLPVHRRNRRGQAGAVHRIVRRLHVAALLARPMGLGQLRLERDHRRGAVRRRRIAEQLEDARDVGPVGGAVAVELLAGRQVVVADRHAQARLADGDHVARRIGRIGVDPEPERRRELGAPHQPDQVGLGRRRVDCREVGAQRLETARLDARLVHPRRVEVGDLLADRAGWSRCPSELIDQRADVRLGLVAQRVEHAEARLVRRDDGRREPFAVHVAEEVVPRLHRRVHLGGVDAEGAERRRGRLRLPGGRCLGEREAGGEGRRRQAERGHGRHRARMLPDATARP